MEPDSVPFCQELVRIPCFSGLEARPFGAAYGTNGSASGPLGIPTLICSPGSLDQAHVVDEWIAVEQLALGVRTYAAIAAAFLGLVSES